MRAGQKTLAFKELNRLIRHGTVPEGDGALLACFVEGRDDSAFEELVARHGPMVRGVCGRLLLNPHDTDDAFQATFLILFRKAGRLRDPDRLGPWLYGVATRVAIKARAQAARRGDRIKTPVEDVSGRDEPTADWLDVRPILDSELGRLSAKLRDVLVLCLLEGATAEEASRRLACPLGTVKSRLARGREALRVRLTSRGVAPAVAAAAVSSVFASPVSAALTRTTLGTIAAGPGGIAPGVVALTRGVAPSMLSRTTVMASLLMGGVALLGIGASMRSPTAAEAAGDEARGQDARGDDRPRAQASIDNLKYVGLAFHNYVSTNGLLPPAAIYGADGQPKLSWRVALLPYLDEGNLYNEFRQDEPWDSPHNKALIGRMPAVFKTPHSPAPDGTTRIRGFAGKGALFDGTKGIGLAEITDGTSNTVLTAVASEPATWTQPGELPFVAGRPLPALDEGDQGQYLVGIADGSVRFVPNDANLLRSMITRAGNEIIHWPPPPGIPTAMVPPRPTSAMPGMSATTTPATPPPLGPQSVEVRLQRVEEKLDRILQKLDAMPGGGGKP